MSQITSSPSRSSASVLLAPTYVKPVPTLTGSLAGWMAGTTGDDVFDPGTGPGSVAMVGNGGDDVFYVHNLGDFVVEAAGQGNATVLVDGLANYVLPANVANLIGLANTPMSLTGNAMNNIIRANGLGDTINGGAGNDTLMGGAGRDTFIVEKGNGSDRIVDFQAGANADVISLLGYGFATFAGVQAAMTQSGSDVVLALGGGETLTFANHVVGDFVAANFGMPASDLHLSATYNATTHQIEITGDFANSGSVLIYGALAGKAIGPGTGTGFTTIARGTGSSFLSKVSGWANGTYTIEAIENGVIGLATVTVGPAPAPPPPPDLHLSATYDATTHLIHLTGDFANSGSVLIYEALAGKAIGPGTGTGVTTIARGTGTSFVSNLTAGPDGTYTIQAIENGVVSQTTVTVSTAPVTVTPPPTTSPPPTSNDLHLSATFDAASHTIHITGNFVNSGSVLIYEALTGKPLGAGTGTGISTVARGTADTFSVNQFAPGLGTYTIQAVENGVVSQVTVTVDAVAPDKPTPPPGQSSGGTSSGSATGTYTYAAVVPQASGPSDVVGLNLQNPGTTALAAREITFGQEFAPGQVPAGRLLLATINGVAVAVQMDVKATNPDGSVRMAVLTMQQPDLAAGATAGVMLQLAPVGATQGPAMDIGAAAQAGGYNFAVDLSLHNADGSTTPFHIDAAQALAAALRNGTASSWLSGPQASQVRIDVPVAGSLHVTFDITAYADGTFSTDVQFNNDIAMGQSGGEVKYDATISQNGATVFAQSNIDQFQYQTWHKLIYSNGTPGVNVQHDTAAMAAAGFIENYDPSTGVKTSLITAEAGALVGNSTTVLGTPSFGILGNAGITQYMATTGGRADIGPTTQANVIWLMTQNAQAQAYALAQADAAGSIPWHLYDPTTGTYLATTQRPTLWVDPRGTSTGGATGLTQQISQYYSKDSPGSGWAIDPGHQPDLSYVAYMLTGNRYYLDQLNAQASYDILITAPSYRQNGQDLVVNGMSQVRVQAWDLRELSEAAFINPDDSQLKAYFTQAVNNNFTNLLATIIPSATAAQGEATGWLPGAYGSTAGVMAPWQQDYFAQVVAMAAEQGNAQAKEVLHWESNYIVGRFLQASNGLDPHDGVAYNMVVGTKAGTLFQTWAEIEQATTGAGLGANFSGQWNALEYPGYQAWALATLASTITVEQSPDAIQAYGWLQAHAQVNAAWQAASPLYDIVPRLADGNLLTSSNVHILTGNANQSVAFGNVDQLVYDNGSGNTTISGGTGINILFAGKGQDLLIGGAGDDFLFGGAGADTLSGGGGHNWLQAGAAGTQFNLATTDAAQDVIAGFIPGRDHLHVTGAGGVALTAPQIQSLIAGATASGGNTTLALSANHTVTINNLTPAQLTSAAFA